MKKLIALFFISIPAHAEILHLREMYLTHKTFRDGCRMPEYDNAKLENREIGQELDLDFNLDVFTKHIFFDNHVWSIVDKWKDTHKASQFRNIGWNFRAGFAYDIFQVSYWHFSKHMLDSDYKGMNFPVEDALEIRVYFKTDSNAL